MYTNVVKLRQLVLDDYVEFDDIPDDLLLLAINKNYLFNMNERNKLRIYGSLNYERLEFLGDSCLELIVADLLFKNYNLKNPQELTEMKSKIVRNSSLHCLSQNKGLCSLILKEDVYKLGNKDCADVFESIIGALYYYLQESYPNPIKFLIYWLNKEFDFENLIQYLIDNQNVNDVCRSVYKDDDYYKYEPVKKLMQNEERDSNLDNMNLNELMNLQKELQRLSTQKLNPYIKNELALKQKQVMRLVSLKKLNL